MNSDQSAEMLIQNHGPETLAAFADAGQRCGPKTILLVEDEAFVRKATAEALESAGYSLLLAKSAAEALEAYRQSFRTVDLLLTDVIMPGMSGRDLADEFANLCPRVRVLLMSGHEQHLAGTGLARQRRKCLAKPFSIDALLARVREVLDTNPHEVSAPA